MSLPSGMKNLFPKIGFWLFLVAASLANGGIPSMNVTVSDASGKSAFKGATRDDGAFATAKLQPGNYVVQFSTKNAAVKGSQYSIVVGAGKKKVVANAVAGDKFLSGGVAMKVQVSAGVGITGQVWVGATAPSPSTQSRDSLVRMQDRAQDVHQEGFHSSLSNTQDKMSHP
jgi:hypothetical protein